MRRGFRPVINFLLGDSHKLSLEQRIFNTLSLLCSVFGVLSVIQNLILKLPSMTVILAAAGMILLTTYYLLSRFKNIFKPLVWPLIMTSTLLIGAIWFFNGGSLGGSLLLYMVMIFFFMVMTRGFSRVLAVTWTILVPLVILIVEYHHPELNIPYPDALTRYIDLGLTFTIAMAILGLGTSQVILNYHRERTKADERADELHKKNDVMHRELEMAQKIQHSMIPLSFSRSDISFYYNPMELVGGDFFDFIEISERELGIFVSDVSGHGVPAAFITTLIKAQTMQKNVVHNDPGVFLAYLNDLLLDVTASHFVTSFYGVFDKKTRVLRYANAGHPSPLIISSKGVRILQSANTSFPLAVFSNSEVNSLEKRICTQSIQLQKADRILFFTDGLMEAVNIHEKRNMPPEHVLDFEQTELYEILEKYHDLPVEEMMDNLVKELTRFRGAEQFDDDICIICLDIV